MLRRWKLKTFPGALDGCRLFDPEGKAINAFDRFSEHLITHQYAYKTRDRYSSAAAKFIDYLYEIGIMGDVTSNAQINRAVDAYPIFLSRGNEYEDVDAKKVAQLRRYAEEIKLGAGLGSEHLRSHAGGDKFASRHRARFSGRSHSDC